MSASPGRMRLDFSYSDSESDNIEYLSEHSSEEHGSDHDPNVVYPAPEAPQKENYTERYRWKNDFTSANELYKVFHCIRMKRPGLKSGLSFRLESEGTTLLYAKAVGRGCDLVVINSDDNIHVKSLQFEYSMRSTKNRAKFELFKKGGATLEMGIHFTNEVSDGVASPRNIKITLGDERQLTSKLPKRTKDGHWIMNFNGKYTLRSHKNAVLVDKTQKRVIMMRKISRNTLEQEVIADFTPVQMFAFGIASFLFPN